MDSEEADGAAPPLLVPADAAERDEHLDERRLGLLLVRPPERLQRVHPRPAVEPPRPVHVPLRLPLHRVARHRPQPRHDPVHRVLPPLRQPGVQRPRVPPPVAQLGPHRRPELRRQHLVHLGALRVRFLLPPLGLHLQQLLRGHDHVRVLLVQPRAAHRAGRRVQELAPVDGGLLPGRPQPDDRARAADHRRVDSRRPVSPRDRPGRRLRPDRPRVEQLGQPCLDAVGGGRRQRRREAGDERAEDGTDAAEHGARGARHEADGLLVALVPEGLLLEATHLDPLRLEILLERVGAGGIAGGRRGHRLHRDRPAQAVPPAERELPLAGLQLVERLHFGAQPGRGRDEPLHLLGLHPEALGDERVEPRVGRPGLEARVHAAEVDPAPQPEPRDGGRGGVQRHDELGAGQPEEERLVGGVEVRDAGRPHRVGPEPGHLLLRQRPVQRQQLRHRRRGLEREDPKRCLWPRRQPEIHGHPHLLHNHQYFSPNLATTQSMERSIELSFFFFSSLSLSLSLRRRPR
ncbi:Os01g0845000 [Oryza sativa Japonica Group]|uniref:Os01g0845000 protein n=1 Tax=Oryza sativa subsp. japonica TaxID=39947 RepID=A0A0N7KE20_ORYSJ|nr:hypothetical protein EE612_006784 [Oryza sativa]BAS75193.1 Os01g0845000 [Oryza sativa Japonica Group]